MSAKVRVGATILWPSSGGFRPFAIHNKGSGLTRQMIGNNWYRLSLAGREIVPHAHRAVAGDIAFEGDVVVVLESERQRRTETVGVDDSLSRVLVTTAVSVLTDREWLAHAAPPRAPPLGASATRTPKKARRAF